jgi:hypothetical protein
MGVFTVNLSHWNSKEYGRKEFMKGLWKMRKKIGNARFQGAFGRGRGRNIY